MVSEKEYRSAISSFEQRQRYPGKKQRDQAKAEENVEGKRVVYVMLGSCSCGAWLGKLDNAATSAKIWSHDVEAWAMPNGTMASLLCASFSPSIYCHSSNPAYFPTPCPSFSAMKSRPVDAQLITGRYPKPVEHSSA